MSRPDVTIVIANHNYGRYLDAAVVSAVDQTSCSVQVVVVDDGSTDSSRDVLRRWEHSVEVVAQDNLGQGAAFNRGFARADAPAVMFLDADDVLLPAAAKSVADALAAPGVARVQFPLRCIDADGQPTGRTIPDASLELASGDLRSRVTTAPDDIPWQPTSGNGFSADVLRRVLPMPETPYRISADHYLSNLVALHGDVVALTEPLGCYRVHGANADHRDHLDLARVRAIIERTVTTHRELATAATELGLSFPADPLAVRSVTFAANRLVSLRLDRAAHPIAGDRVLGLALLGVRSAFGRRDVGPTRRLMMAGWCALTAVAPRTGVRRLAHIALTR